MESAWLISYVILWIITLSLATVVVVHSRMLGLLHYRFGPAHAKTLADGPEIGTKLTKLSGISPDEKKWNLTFPFSTDLILVFVSPQCSTCNETLPHLKDFSRLQSSPKMILVSTIDDIRMNQAYIAYRGLEKMEYVIGEKIADELNIEGVPYALHINQNGTVGAKGLVNNYENVIGLTKAAAKFNLEGEYQSK